MTKLKLIRQALKLNQAIENFKLGVNSSGNASVFDRSLQIIAIKPSGIPFKQLNEKNIVLINQDGKINGKNKPSVDTTTHLELYKHLTDCRAIMHIHSPYTTAFAINEKEIPVLSTLHADYFGKNIPCAPFTDHRNGDLAKHLLKFKKEGVPAILHGRHGAWIFAKTAEEVIKLALVLEEVAKTAILATIASYTHERIKPMDVQNVQQLHTQFKSNYGQKERFQESII